MTRVRVKVCGLRTEEAIDAAVDAGADAVGLVFAESVRRVGISDAAGLLRRVPPFVQRVGVFLHPSAQDVGDAVAALPLDLVQTDGEDFGAGAACVPTGRRLPVVRAGAGLAERVRTALDMSGAALVEGPRSGTGELADLDALSALPERVRARLIVAGGLSVENVGAVIERVRPLGVDVSSGVERARGVKDPDLIYAFVRAVRRAERNGERENP